MLSVLSYNLQNIFEIKNNYNIAIKDAIESTKKINFQYNYIYNSGEIKTDLPYDINECVDNKNNIEFVIYDKSTSDTKGNVLIKKTIELAEICNKDKITEYINKVNDRQILLNLKSLMNTMDNLLIGDKSEGDIDKLKERYNILKNEYDTIEKTKNNLVLLYNNERDIILNKINTLKQIELFFFFELNKNRVKLAQFKLSSINDSIVNNIVTTLKNNSLNLYTDIADLFKDEESCKNINLFIKHLNKNEILKKKIYNNIHYESISDIDGDNIIDKDQLSSEFKLDRENIDKILSFIYNFTFYKYLYFLIKLNQIKHSIVNLERNYNYYNINKKIGEDTITTESYTDDESKLITKLRNNINNTIEIEPTPGVKKKKIVKRKRKLKKKQEKNTENLKELTLDIVKKIDTDLYTKQGLTDSERSNKLFEYVIDELTKVLQVPLNDSEVLKKEKTSEIITILELINPEFLKNHSLPVIDTGSTLDVNPNQTVKLDTSDDEPALAVVADVSAPAAAPTNIPSVLVPGPRELRHLQHLTQGRFGQGIQPAAPTPSDDKLLRDQVKKIMLEGDLDILTARIIRQQLADKGFDVTDKLKIKEIIEDMMEIVLQMGGEKTELKIENISIYSEEVKSDTTENKIEKIKQNLDINNKYLVLTPEENNIYISIINYLHEFDLFDTYKLPITVKFMNISHNSEESFYPIYEDAALELRKRTGELLIRNREIFQSNEMYESIIISEYKTFNNYINLLLSKTQVIKPDLLQIKILGLLLGININIVYEDNTSASINHNDTNTELKFEITEKNEKVFQAIDLILVNNIYFYVSNKSEIEQNLTVYEKFVIYTTDITHENHIYTLAYILDNDNNHVKIIGVMNKSTELITKFSMNEKNIVNDIFTKFKNFKNTTDILHSESVTKYIYWKDVITNKLYRLIKQSGNSNSGIMDYFGLVVTEIINGELKCKLKLK